MMILFTCLAVWIHLRDIEVINLELALADLTQLDEGEKTSKRKDPDANTHETYAIAKLIEALTTVCRLVRSI